MDKLYSTEKIMLYVGNDESQCVEMIDLFVQLIPKEFETLESAIINKDWKQAYEISHRIKPSIEILEIKNAADEFTELHTKLHQQIDLESVPNLFHEIHENLKKAIAQINKDYNN